MLTLAHGIGGGSSLEPDVLFLLGLAVIVMIVIAALT
jgi:hypothetical protein